jgi:hypothetical protein
MGVLLARGLGIYLKVHLKNRPMPELGVSSWFSGGCGQRPDRIKLQTVSDHDLHRWNYKNRAASTFPRELADPV